MDWFQVVRLLVAMIWGSTSAWILEARMRHRIRRALGVRALSEAELTSLNTWMKVDAAEKGKRGRKAT